MATNEFMLNLHKTLLDKTYGKDNHKLSDSTASAYLKALFNLHDKKPFKSLTFLRNTEEIEKKLVDYAESTKKTIYASLASVLSIYKDKPAYKATHKYYYDKMMTKAEEAKKIDTAEKTETQEKNWVGWEEVEKKRKDMADEIAKFVDNKKVSPTEYGQLLKYLVLSLYVDVPPRRNQDYLDMLVGMPTKTFAESPDKNYLIIKKKVPTEFIFNKYKTNKKYGRQTVAIPETLGKVITAYLKHRPTTADEKKAKVFPLLVFHDGKPLVQANAITRVLNSVFDKNIGSSMLRHMYLSNKMNISEMKADAHDMGHSLNEQQKYLKAPTETSQ
jgi:hypothetical protein